jgi:hypothetical protein
VDGLDHDWRGRRQQRQRQAEERLHDGEVDDEGEADGRR